jgi:hypothetical protein
MRDKSEISSAILYSLVFVWSMYVAVGVGVAYLYSGAPGGIQGNVLQNLPPTATAATIVRILMASVC